MLGSGPIDIGILQKIEENKSELTWDSLRLTYWDSIQLKILLY
jgi:hypothetical protein